MDERIKALVDVRRETTVDDKLAILDGISQAPFYAGDARIPLHLRGLSFEGRPLGNREPSLRAHLARRVLDDEQWSAGTTEQQYLEDCAQRYSMFMRRWPYTNAEAATWHPLSRPTGFQSTG